MSLVLVSVLQRRRTHMGFIRGAYRYGLTSQQCLALKNQSRFQQLFGLQGWMSQLVFSLCWTPDEKVGSITSEGMPQQQAGQMNLPEKSEGKQAKRQGFLLLCRLSPENVAQIDSGSTTLEWSNQENPPQMCPAAWALVDSRCSQLDKQHQPSQCYYEHNI